MKQKEIREYLEKGYIQIHTMLEVVGNPKEHVEKSLKAVLEAIEKEKGVLFISTDIQETEDVGEGLFGSFCEAELLIKDIGKLGWLMFNFTPATIEVLEPGKFTFKEKELTDFISDMLAGIHEFNMTKVNINSKNVALQRNMGAIIRNSALYVIGNEAKSAQDIATPLGLKTEDLTRILEFMIKEGTITKEEHLYRKV